MSEPMASSEQYANVAMAQLRYVVEETAGRNYDAADAIAAVNTAQVYATLALASSLREICQALSGSRGAEEQ